MAGEKKVMGQLIHVPSSSFTRFRFLVRRVLEKEAHDAHPLFTRHLAALCCLRVPKTDNLVLDTMAGDRMMKESECRMKGCGQRNGLMNEDAGSLSYGWTSTNQPNSSASVSSPLSSTHSLFSYPFLFLSHSTSMKSKMN